MMAWTCGRAAGAALGLGLCAGGLQGCFHGDFLAYTPCATSESCDEVGLPACVRLPDSELRGFCSQTCAADDACPMGQDGEATPTCAAIGEARVCVLACVGDEAACPAGYACAEVATVDAAGPPAVCFPEAAP
jgi:hypothetical protein